MSGVYADFVVAVGLVSVRREKQVAGASSGEPRRRKLRGAGLRRLAQEGAQPAPDVPQRGRAPPQQGDDRPGGLGGAEDMAQGLNTRGEDAGARAGPIVPDGALMRT